jgi:hypothetical protein
MVSIASGGLRWKAASPRKVGTLLSLLDEPLCSRLDRGDLRIGAGIKRRPNCHSSVASCSSRRGDCWDSERRCQPSNLPAVALYRGSRNREPRFSSCSWLLTPHCPITLTSWTCMYRRNSKPSWIGLRRQRQHYRLDDVVNRERRARSARSSGRRAAGDRERQRDINLSGARRDSITPTALTSNRRSPAALTCWREHA